MSHKNQKAMPKWLKIIIGTKIIIVLAILIFLVVKLG